VDTEDPVVTPDNDLSRRTFLRNVILAVVVLITAVLGVLLTGFAIVSALRKEASRWVEVIAVDQIPVGEPTQVNYTYSRTDGWISERAGRSVWIVNKDNVNFVVYDPRCTHLGCPYHWDSNQKKFLCPCHGGVFDIEGKVLAGPPPRPLDRLTNKVENGKLLIQVS